MWDPTAAGVLRLPSGRLVRRRALRKPLPAGPVPAFGVYLLGTAPPPVDWESRWLRWPDFRLPADRALAGAALSGGALILPGTAACADDDDPCGVPLPWREARRIVNRTRVPHFPRRDFNVLSYGAVADGTTDNTAAFAAAIDACHRRGGG